MQFFFLYFFRTIDAFGSLSLSPWTLGRSIDAKRVLDPKYCKRGKPTDMGTCNKHPCPGKGNSKIHYTLYIFEVFGQSSPFVCKILNTIK